MTWEEACADPFLAELPYKIELNEFGHPILVSPHNRNHSVYQSLIQDILRDQKDGGVIAQEAAIATSKGTRSADVAWMTVELWKALADGAEFTTAPEVCIEVLSPTNSQKEMEEKRLLYFEAGAYEVWICDLMGNLTFYHRESQDTPNETSTRFPNFPSLVELP